MSAQSDLRARTRAAAAVLGGIARLDEPMAPYTTYRIGGPAALFVSPTCEDELQRAGEVARRWQLPVVLLGRGSNMLVADAGVDAMVVSLAAMPSRLDVLPDVDHDPSGDPEPVVVEVDGGAALPVVARRLSAQGVRGFEWAVGVPGSIGGAVRMNAGGHGSDMAAVLDSIHLFDLHTGQHGWVPSDRLRLRFRGSGVGAHQAVVTARLRLRRGDAAESEAELAEVVRWRREHQPGGHNVGSVFVNPVPGVVTAAELIDGVGLRGLRIGTAEVSPKHANFIQSDDGGSAADVRAVIATVRERVREAFGYVLRAEVRLLGFDDVDPTDDATEPGGAQREPTVEPRGVVIDG